MDYKEQVPLITQLRKWFGFSEFKDNQEAIIRNILQGSDTFVLMPTGGGKSLCYQLPALIQSGIAVVVSPLIALMKNQVDLIRGYSDEDSIAHFLNSSLTKPQVRKVKDDMEQGKTKLLYIAPESLNKPEYIELLQRETISLYAVDEAHCISEWGHDFRPEYRRIRPMIDAIGAQAPIMALTATATPKVQDDIQKTLGMHNAVTFSQSFNRPNLFYEVRPKHNATREIIRYIRDNPGKSGIIYCMSRKKVEQMAQVLSVNGISALPYHAGMDPAQRNANQDAFLQEEVDVIVATIAFGMGIDKPDVRYVIHYDMPKSLEGYYQETGRAGRDGGEGRCIAFFAEKDMQTMRRFNNSKPLAEQEIARQLLQEAEHYALGGDCRRIMLLNYFGEQYPHERCGHCDNCAKSMPRFEGKDDLILALSAVQSLTDAFHIEHYVQILLGEESPNIQQHQHFTLPMYGKGAEQGAAHWESIFRQAMLHGFLTKDIKQYGLVSLTEKGVAFLEKPQSISLVKDHDYEVPEESDAQEAQQSQSVFDDILYRMLRNLRKNESKRLNVPPYVIFPDEALAEMTIQYPVKVEDMERINGISMSKARRYGTPFVKLIGEWVEEQQIVRPSDIVVHKVPKHSQQKFITINSIDQRIPFEDIAQMRNISMDELLDEIDSLIRNGVKINIQYYLDMVVDPNIQEEIREYFHTEAESDSFQDACKILIPRDIREEEIRLVRMAYLSEMAI